MKDKIKIVESDLADRLDHKDIDITLFTNGGNVKCVRCDAIKIGEPIFATRDHRLKFWHACCIDVGSPLHEAFRVAALRDPDAQQAFILAAGNFRK